MEELSAEARAALQEFLSEQATKRAQEEALLSLAGEDLTSDLRLEENFDENWNLSQFWVPFELTTQISLFLIVHGLDCAGISQRRSLTGQRR